jgi:hypothetical protein
MSWFEHLALAEHYDDVDPQTRSGPDGGAVRLVAEQG